MSSLLEQILAKAAARRERQVTISLPELEMDLVCNVPTDMESVEKMQAAARAIDKGKATATHFARALVAAQTAEIHISGQLLTVGGDPVTFRDPELWPEIGVANAKAAVVALIGVDGDIVSIASELMSEAGFNPDENPT